MRTQSDWTEIVKSLLQCDGRTSLEKKTFRQKAEVLVVLYNLPRELLDEPKVEQDAPKSTKTSKSGTIQAMAEEMILRSKNGTNEGIFSYDEILVQVLIQFPNAKTTYNCLRWYSSNLKKRGFGVPKRPAK